ncbi:hypothetical protein D3C76_558820 [compost metagenome]
MFDAAGQALRIAVLHQNVRRRTGQESLEFFRAALDGQVQAIGGENHPGAWAVEAQVLGKHHLIVIAEIRPGTAQLDGKDRNPPSCQPAGNAVHDHPVSEISEGPARVLVVLQQDDFRQALLTYQLRRQVFEDQRQKRQAAGHSRRHVGLEHGAAAQERKAAGLEFAWVHAKELIIPAPCQQPPQARISRGRNAGVGAAQQLRVDADLDQHLVRGDSWRAALQQCFTHQLNGDGVFFRHGSRQALFLFEWGAS